MLYVYQDTDWAAEELTRKAVLCTAGKHDSQAMQRREAIAERTGLQRSRVTRHCQTLAGSGIVVARAGSTAMDQTMVGAGSTARVDGRIIKSRDDVKANLPDFGTDRNGSRGENNL